MKRQAVWMLACLGGCGAPLVDGLEGVGNRQAALTQWLIQPDVNGNLFSPTGGLSIAARAGDSIVFSGLGPRDNLIEVASPSATSNQLCSDAALRTHAVAPQDPLPSGPYAGNELSGPYHTYPAGLYVMSPGSDECQLLEKSTKCDGVNEKQRASWITPSGWSQYLCKVERYLMDPAKPSEPSTNPPTENPACIRGRVLDSTWSDPAVQGVFVRLAWKDINPSFEEYDWSILDEHLMKAVRYGKTVTVGIRVGGHAIPEWAFQTGDPEEGKVAKVWLRDWPTKGGALPPADCGELFEVASPSDKAFRKLFKKVIRAMGEHVREDQRKFSVLAGVKVTGMGQDTLENRLPKRCNIAVRGPGDRFPEGHLVSMSSTDLEGGVVFDSDYEGVTIANRFNCICNPQVLAAAGYRPSVLRTFYKQIERTIHESFGWKQLVYMNISEGFPQIGEEGRFLGDHLVPPIGTASTYPEIAHEPDEIPEPAATTKAIVEDARNGEFAGGDLTVARAFGVENAALNVLGFSVDPAWRCSQQAGISWSTGSAAFPIWSEAPVDGAVSEHCPNWIAAKEGIRWDKVGGFQVQLDVHGATGIDESLWNMTLNTNGLFFEYYEDDHWLAVRQASANPGAVLNPNPAVRQDTLTDNHRRATAKSLVAWNELLLSRAASFSADSRHDNLFQRNPFPSGYTVPVVSEPGRFRFLFNSRACDAWYTSRVPVRINTIQIVN